MTGWGRPWHDPDGSSRRYGTEWSAYADYTADADQLATMSMPIVAVTCWPVGALIRWRSGCMR